MVSKSITATRYHDLSCGHRVVGHESKCKYLHGHNYRIHFTCRSEVLDSVGRVIDFGVMKEKLCVWLEDHWDHRFLAYEHDLLMFRLKDLLSAFSIDFDLDKDDDPLRTFNSSIVWVPFNPTAENMADYLLRIVGPAQLSGTGVELIEVRVEETRKCSALAQNP